MNRFVLFIVCCVLFAGTAFTQTKPSIEGVWKVVEWQEAGKTYTSPQPGLIIFTKGYYSIMLIMLAQPRPAVPAPKDRQNLTDADKIARFEQWRSFTATSGTYEAKGESVSMRPIVAKAQWDMTRPTPDEFAIKFEGPNTLWLIPPRAAAVGLRTKLTRLE